MVTEFSLRRWIPRRPLAGAPPPRNRPNALAVAGLVALVALAPTAQAQGGGKGFLFKRPIGSFSFYGGYAVANAASDVFDDATSQLTLNRRDFSDWMLGGDISFAATEKVDLVFDGNFTSAGKASEFREFVDNNDQPIAQKTKFKRVPLTAGLKYYFADRGRAVSQFAYIPKRYAPYIGVGAGAMYYRFSQSGDFVDFNTPDLEVFGATIEDNGWAPMAQGTAGLDMSVGPWLAVTAEGRYQWAKARLDPQQFEGYDKIDLSGFTGTVGFRVRF